MKIFPATERGFILIDDPPGRLRLRSVRQRNDQGQTPVPSRTLTAHVMQQGNAVLIRDTTSDPLFKGTESMMFTVRTALCVPLLAHNGQPLGLIQLDRLAGKRGFKLADLELLAAVSVPIGIVVENNRLLKERLSWAAARKIQTALLPRGSPKVPGYTFWEYYKPSLEVGGDLYDYIRVERAGASVRRRESAGDHDRRRRRATECRRPSSRRASARKFDILSTPASLRKKSWPESTGRSWVPTSKAGS